MVDQSAESGRIPTWRHLNDEIRLRGLSGSQLGLGILIFFMSFSMGVKVIPIVVILELALYKWYISLIEDNDPFPLVTRNVKNASKNHIQDKTDFYYRLMHTDFIEDEENK